MPLHLYFAQDPATPFIFLALFIFSLIIAAIFGVGLAAKKVWQTRHNKQAPGRRVAIIVLIIAGIYTLMWIISTYFSNNT